MRERITARLDPYRLLLFLLITIYIGIFYGLATDTHVGMRTHKADLGQIDQAVWNSSRGRFLAQTDNGYEATRLTDHVEPILVLISPTLWLWDDVRALLLLQAIAVGIGAWFLYEIALPQFDRLLTPRQRTQVWQLEPLRNLTRPMALALAVAYLLAPQLQSALLTEFHAAPLALPLILWAFWAVEKRRWGQFFVAALLVAGVKEEMALLAAGLGVWAMWRSVATKNEEQRSDTADEEIEEKHTLRGSSFFDLRNRGLFVGAAIVVISIIWFAVATFVIVPAHAVEVYGVAASGYFRRYGALGDSPADIFVSLLTQPGLVWQIVSQPARVSYLGELLMAFGFLSLLAPEVLLLALPVLLANVLSAYPAQYYGDFHYSAPLIPYFAVAAAYGLGRLWRWLARRSARTSGSFQQMPAASTGTMAAASIFFNSRTAIRPMLTLVLVFWVLFWSSWGYLQRGRGPLAARHDPPPITEHHRRLDAFVAQIPSDAAVTSTAGVHPHVSHRRYIYQFPAGLDAPVPANWALLDVTTNTDMAPGDLKARVDEMLVDEWGVVDGADGFLLLARGAPQKTIPDAFYDFARADEMPAALAGDHPLTLLGYEVDDWPRWRQTKLSGIWQVGPGFDPSVHMPQLDVRTPSGVMVGSLVQVVPPALVWYPPESWQPGEAVRISSLPLYLPVRWGLVTDAQLAYAEEEGALVDDEGQTMLVAAFQRGEHDRLSPLVMPVDRSGDGTLATFQLEDGSALRLQANLLQDSLWPNAIIDVPLQWHGISTWQAQLSAFVHLRQDDVNVAQADGPPRYVIHNSTADSGTGILADWRQMAVPTDASGEGVWEIVVGVYDPITGRRLNVVNDSGEVVGQEVVIGILDWTEVPAPDQACALVPASCAAQSHH